MSHEPMHRIIRLKRYEQPPEGYFDDFLEEFRRRRELMEAAPPSFASRFREEIALFLDGFRVPSLAFAGAAAVAVAACLLIFRDTSRPAAAKVYDVSYAPVTVQGVQPVSWKTGIFSQPQASFLEANRGPMGSIVVPETTPSAANTLLESLTNPNGSLPLQAPAAAMPLPSNASSGSGNSDVPRPPVPAPGS